MTTIKVDVRELVKNIKPSQKSVNKRDEIAVMKEMLNDKNYSAVVYGNQGPIESFSPGVAATELAASILNGAADLPKQEAQQLASMYEFTNQDAANMINIGNEFINLYLQTGRKYSFGGRQDHEFAIMQKVVEPCTKTYNKQVGINPDGSRIYEQAQTQVPGFVGLSTKAGCPSWVKKGL